MPEAVTTTETVVIGSNELPYLWRGNTVSATGRYMDVEQYATITCDSAIHILDLTVLTAGIYDEQSVTICDTETPYIWYGESYTATGKYTYTEQYVGTDIDSIQHILTLTVNSSVYAEEHITACDSYTWNGDTYTQSGEYVYTTTAANGCDSVVTLHLTINQTQFSEETVVACDSYTWNGKTYTASGDYEYRTTTVDGCERLEVLHLTINRSEREEFNATSCDSYEWHGQVYTESGDYEYRTTTSEGCERVEILHLTINNSEVGETEYATICYGETYTWNGRTYSTAGEYTITLSNTNGCDSVATLHLTIMPEAVTTTETVVIGSNELPYLWRGNTVSATGRYMDVEQYATITCDSAIHILDLTVLTAGIYDEQSVTICDTETPYIWYGESYTATGKYTYTEQYVGTDIDSIQHILTLTVNSSVYAEEHITACDSYTWNGDTYTQSGEYVYTTTAANGCDSVVTLHLTINQTQFSEETVVACDSYTWNGKTYTASGDYEYRTTTVDGCERLEVLHLTINKSEREEYWATAFDEYYWDRNGNTYYSSGDYEHYTTTEQGCERVEILHLTIIHSEHQDYYENACDAYEWHGETYTQSGNYEYRSTLENGCERVEVLHLTIYSSQYEEYWETACDEYWWNGNQYTESGDYTYSYPLYDWGTGTCDRTEVLHLTINKRDTVHYYETACDEYWWDPYGLYYNTSGDYEYYTTNEHGCERVEILHLTIIHSEHQDYYENACDAYEWHGETYTQSGNYEYRSTLENGCERVEVLHLTIYSSQYEEYWETACDEYWWNGNQYTESGDYTYSYPLYDWGTGTCDRTEVLHLTINKRDTVHYYETACDEYWWDPYGLYYNTSGDYEYYTTNEHGCERVEILHLTINYSEYEEYWETACDSYEWHGEVYTERGNYEYYTTTEQGCPRTEVLHLTIKRSKREEYWETACDQYEWHGQVYTESGDYEFHTTTVEGCERLEILHLTILPDAVTETEELALCPAELPYEWYGYSLTEAGSYTATEQYAAGCDSVVHELTLNVYVQTLPTQVTLPIVRKGEAIDVSIPTAEIQAHIAANTWYAPNALVNWYIQRNADWTILTTDPVESSVSEVVLKYAVDTDCGSIESEPMSISVETTAVDNIQTDKIETYKIIRDDKLWIIRNGNIYSAEGHLISRQQAISKNNKRGQKCPRLLFIQRGQSLEARGLSGKSPSNSANILRKKTLKSCFFTKKVL